MNKVDVLVGLQFGDEGKGKVINAIASKYDTIVRFQGGANSGHTVYDVDGDKVVFNVVPSGMIEPNVTGVITHGVVINPHAFVRELERLESNKYMKDVSGRLLISLDASVTIPTHILIDIFTERHRQKSGTKIIGSTNRGNTPTYEDKVARRGLKIRDIVETDSEWSGKYLDLYKRHIKYLTDVLGATMDEILTGKHFGDLTLEQYEFEWAESVRSMQSLTYTNTTLLLNRHLVRGRKILLEAAQGAMLDVDYGTYPYVTSTSVTAPAAIAMSGLPAQCIGRVYGVMKPYITRVGSGFFPTEITEDSLDWQHAEKIVKKGNEFGSVTKRRRKIGWLDLPQLRYACMINGITDIILCKVDVMSEVEHIPVCYAYIENSAAFAHDAETYNVYDGGHDMDAKMITMKSFGDTSNINEVSSNNELMLFIDRINEAVYGLPTEPRITMVSVSPKSDIIVEPKSGW